MASPNGKKNRKLHSFTAAVKAGGAKDPPPKSGNNFNFDFQKKPSTADRNADSANGVATTTLKIGYASCTNIKVEKRLAQETPLVSTAAVAPAAPTIAAMEASSAVVLPKNNGASFSSSATIRIASISARSAAAQGSIATTAADMKDRMHSSSHSITRSSLLQPEDARRATAPMDGIAEKGSVASSASDSIERKLDTTGSPSSPKKPMHQYHQRAAEKTTFQFVASLPSNMPGLSVLPQFAPQKRPSSWQHEACVDHQLPPQANDIVGNHGSQGGGSCNKKRKFFDPERTVQKAAEDSNSISASSNPINRCSRTSIPESTNKEILGYLISSTMKLPFDFARVCNSDLQMFGEPNSKLRRAVRNRKYNLKVLLERDPDKFFRMCKRYGLVGDDNFDEKVASHDIDAHKKTAPDIDPCCNDAVKPPGQQVASRGINETKKSAPDIDLPDDTVQTPGQVAAAASSSVVLRKLNRFVSCFFFLVLRF